MDIIELAKAVEAAPPLDKLPAPDDARQMRLNAGVNLAIAGAVMGVSGASVARWETGANVPRLTTGLTYRKFLSALGGAK